MGDGHGHPMAWYNLRTSGAIGITDVAGTTSARSSDWSSDDQPNDTTGILLVLLSAWRTGLTGL